MALNTHTALQGTGLNNGGSGYINVERDVHINAPPTQDAAGDCLCDLFLTDPSEDRRAMQRKKGRRAANTCEWILETEPLAAWLDSNNQSDGRSNVLWLYGNPGTGKSTMAIFLTEALPQLFVKTPGRILTYFFCDSSFDMRRTATGVIRGLLWQLAQHQQLCDHLLHRYRERRAKLFETFDAVWSVFEDVAAKATGPLFCIIDALDECDAESQNILLQQLEALQHSRVAPNLRVLITSRPYPEIRESLELFAEAADLAAFPESKEDIRRCIEDKVEILQRRKKYTNTVSTQVKHILEGKAQGTFLWVGLACEELGNVPSKNAVKFLERLPLGLHALYKSLLDTAIQQQEDKDVLKRILGIVAVAQRPLSVSELSEACLLHLDTEDAETQLQFMRDDIASCRLIITIQDEKVILLHQSVKDFLIGAGADHFLDELQAHADIAFRCIDQLIGQLHRDESYDIGRYYNERSYFESHTFLSYSIDFWPDHARMARAAFEVRDSHSVFFAPESPVRERWLDLLRLRLPHWDRPPRVFSLLHISARWGISTLLDYACSQKLSNNWNVPGISSQADRVKFGCLDSEGQTALEEAARRGYCDIMDRLLNEGAAVTIGAIRNAAMGGEAVMRFILDQRRDEITITDAVIETVARFGDEVVMKLLLDQRGYEIAITDAVVQAAAGNWHSGEAILKLFFDGRGDEISITDAVIQAAAGNWRSGEAILHLFLCQRQGIVINAKLSSNVVGLLLDSGADLTVSDENRWTLLHLASANGRLNMAKLLFEKGSSISVENNDERTPLHFASANGRLKMVKMLLKGADFNVTDRTGQTPLHLATINGHLDVVKVFLDEPAINVNQKDNNGRNALFHAARTGHRTIVELLCEQSSDLSTRDYYGATPLFAAVRNGNVKVAELLIGSDTSNSARDAFGQSLLWWASKTNNTRLAQLVGSHADMASWNINELEGIVAGKAEAYDPKSPWCDVCTIQIPDSNGYYFCEICDGGTFCICLDCFGFGMKCRDDSHAWKLDG